MSAAAPLVELSHLVKHYPVRSGFGLARGSVHAVDDVSLTIAKGETVGLVGESGCGKSTLARCVVRLVEPTGGSLRFAGQDIAHLGPAALRPLRRHMQMVFQDPMASLNPRKTVAQAIGDGLDIHGIGTPSERWRKVEELAERVGLSPAQIGRRASELSGGQRQRVGIARALALGPEFIVADEPVSALDVSVQADILNLFKDLQTALGITYLFISHDLGVIRQVSDRVGVMYLGKLVELAPAEAFYAQPLHRYSEALLQAVAVPDPERRGARRRAPIMGDVPSPIAPPSGCRFHPRCAFATEICRREEPPLRSFAGGRLAACHHPAEAAPA